MGESCLLVSVVAWRRQLVRVTALTSLHQEMITSYSVARLTFNPRGQRSHTAGDK